MSETQLASAVALPEPTEELESTTNGLKRRQSETAEQAHEQEQKSKRQRISPGKNSPPDQSQQDSNNDDNNGRPTSQNGGTEARNRKSRPVDEKQRGKRLFGALLGNLNQPSDRTSKRRQEIESRRKAELQRQDDERLAHDHRKRERLLERRRRAQVGVDEENMRVRHANMLDRANFLQTSSEPKLFYRPWDLRPEEEDRIDEQLKEAQAQIDDEIERFKAQKRRSNDLRPDSQVDIIVGEGSNMRDYGGHTPRGTEPAEADAASAKSTAAANNEQKHREQTETRPAEVPESDPPANYDTNVAAEQQRPASKGSAHAEEDGEHVIEGDEDTVIY